MLLHTPTLLLVNVAVAATFAFCLRAVASRARHDGLVHWAWGAASYALAYLLLGLRGQVADWVSVVLANGLLVATFAFFAEGLCEFQQRRPRSWLIWTPVGVLLLLFPFLLSHTKIRIAVITLLLVLQCAGLLYLIASKLRETPGRGSYFVAVGLVLLVVMLVLRLTAIVVGGLDINSITDNQQGHAGFLLASTVIVVLLSLGLLLMTKERADQQNQTLAMQDELTGLSNRRAIEAILAKQQALAQRHGWSLALLLIDIDHFKQINDTHGHLGGDKALRDVAACLGKRLREQDYVGRWGGEEFVVILPDTQEQGAMVLAEELRRGVEQTRFESAEGKPMPLTISLGLHVQQPAARLLREDIIGIADRALYLAKQNGRNRVEQL